MNELIQLMLIYLGVLMLLMFVINIFTKGFLFKYLNARSRKKSGKVLLMVDAKYFSYLQVGTLREGWLTYKDRNKATRRISVSNDYNQECAEQFLGVVWMKVDEEKNAILKKDYKAVTGYDAVHNDELMQQCLNRSKLNDYKKTLQIIMIIVGVSALLTLGGLVVMMQMKKAILVQLTYCDLRTLGNSTIKLAENVVTGGNMI